MKCPKCKKSDEVVTRPDGTKYCLDCGERIALCPSGAVPSDVKKCGAVTITRNGYVEELEEENRHLKDMLANLSNADVDLPPRSGSNSKQDAYGG